MRGFSFWKAEYMLRRNVESMHFRSSGGAGLHNVTGQGGAKGHAAGALVRNVHLREGEAEHAADT